MRGLRRFRVAAMGLACLAALVACGSPGSPKPRPDGTFALEGLWTVTPGEGTDYGAGGTNTLEFGSEASGHASFISRSKANGIKSCEAQPYELLADGTLWLDGWAYEVHELGDLVLLANDTDTLVLRRVDGAPPVTPCLQAEAVPFASPAVPLGDFSVLNGVGANLYFNTGAAGNPIVALDVVSKALGTARTYTGTSHRWVVGARSSDLFYGHCACGGSTVIAHFDLAANTALADVDVREEYGTNVTIRYGYWDGANFVAGGRDDRDRNLLVTLDGNTLQRLSQREFLPGAGVSDVALVGSELLALVGRKVVVVGADGIAEETTDLGGLEAVTPVGIAAVGSDLFVLARDAEGNAAFFQVDLP